MTLDVDVTLEAVEAREVLVDAVALVGAEGGLVEVEVDRVERPIGARRVVRNRLARVVLAPEALGAVLVAGALDLGGRTPGLLVGKVWGG